MSPEPSVYGLFYASATFLSQNFVGQFIRPQAAPGLDHHVTSAYDSSDVLFAAFE
jgi:hypothetical protein